MMEHCSKEPPKQEALGSGEERNRNTVTEMSLPNDGG